MSEARDEHSQAAAAPEVHLTCLNCDYDLTGLPENRCPECGEAFDPDELRRFIAGEPQRVLRGPGGRPLKTTFAIWWTVLWHPREFAQRFPARHDHVNAAAYSLKCYGAAAAVLLFVSIALDGITAPVIALIETVPIVLLAGLVNAIFCWSCEAVIAGLLAAVVRPTHAKPGYHFWRGLTHYASGFTVLNAFGGALVLLAAFAADGYGTRGQIATFSLMCGLAAGAFYWWAKTLAVMVLQRSRPGPARWIGCLLIPVIGAGSVALAYWLTIGQVTFL